MRSTAPIPPALTRRASESLAITSGPDRNEMGRLAGSDGRACCPTARSPDPRMVRRTGATPRATALCCVQRSLRVQSDTVLPGGAYPARCLDRSTPGPSTVHVGRPDPAPTCSRETTGLGAGSNAVHWRAVRSGTDHAGYETFVGQELVLKRIPRACPRNRNNCPNAARSRRIIE